MSDAPVSLPDDPAELRVMIAALEAENARMRADVERMMATVRAHEALVQALQIRIARLQRQRFGASSERTWREIEQLELALEALEVAASSAGEPIPDDEDGTRAVEEPRPAVDAPPRRRRPRVSATTARASASCRVQARPAPIVVERFGWSVRRSARSWRRSRRA